MKPCRNLYICLLLLLIPTLVYAGDWNNYIINYSKSLYGNGSQTWQIRPFKNRWVFFANQNGMVQFSGSSWSLFTLHNGTSLRSICTAQNSKRIYVGGINEFGYYSPNANGKMTYKCLSEQMRGKQSTIGNIWNIFDYDNTLYFVGDGLITKYVGNKFKIISANAKIDCSGMSDGTLYIGTTKGIFILAGNTILPLQGAERLQNKRIRSILPFGNKVLIVTAFDGIFLYDGKDLHPYVTGLEPFLKQNEIFCAALSNNRLAVGSIRNGIAMTDLVSRQTKYFNEMNGMQNNTVLSAAFDSQGNLWAGLDSGGVDYILLNSPLSNLYSFPYSYGTGYSACLSDGLLYLGTNRGLFYMSPNSDVVEHEPTIKAISKGGGQVWSIQKIGNDIFCGHDRGLYLLHGTELKKIANINGVWTCTPAIGEKDKMLVGVYDGIYIIKKVNGIWVVSNKIAGINESCRWFVQESPQSLWLANGSDLWQYATDKQLTHAKKIRTYNLRKLIQADKGTKVYYIKGKIILATTKGLYQINNRTKQLEPSNIIEKFRDGVSCITQYNSSIITLSPEHISTFNAQTGKETNSYFEIPSLPLVLDAETIIPISDTQMIIPNDNGFALFNTAQKDRMNILNDILHIKNVYQTYPKDTLIYTDNWLSIKNIPEISYNHNSIRLEYGITSAIRIEGIVYQFRLNNREWSEFTTSKVKEFSNLHEGEYTFEVRAMQVNGNVLSHDEFTFRVLPPWYRTAWAYFIYLILFGILLRYIYIWDDIRVKRKNQQAVKEKDRQMKAMEKVYEEEKAEKEQQIVELEKEKIEYELKHKSQEMANLMINFVRKNEILTEIRADLFKVLATLKGDKDKDAKQMLILVRNKIDADIQGDEVLKKIEDQFDVVHNNFMKRLRERHPDLSSNERLMCAYLKMNLSTKEIAPLLNISVRGVETIRYRLRKKFQLEREDGLIEYLNSL
jgi:ligand-binding sensor domain-containing protein/DNA-binding CsgD family transcriptional regulator